MTSEKSEEEVCPPSPLQLPNYLLGTPSVESPLNTRELSLVEEETQKRIKLLLEGTSELSKLDPQTFSDPEILRRLTSSVSTALDEAANALSKMRNDSNRNGPSATPLSTQNTPTHSVLSLEESSRMLAEACSQGDWLAVQRLLSQSRNIHEPGEDGESLLSLACSAGYYELVEVLLRMRAGVDDRGLKGDSTPLMEAASGGYADIVKLLLEHGADVNAKSAAGNTALTYACCGGFEDVVVLLLDAGADVEEPNENGHTPLMEAASGGHIGVAGLLLNYKANINKHSSEFKESALTLACYKGHLGMVRFLLEKGADQEHKTDEMHTALMEASMDGHVDVARLLLDHGAHVNMPKDSFESPLTLASCGGHYDLAALLISRGAQLEETNDEGYTALMEAAREGHEEVVKLLVANGANVNSTTEETQETALTLSCCGGFLPVVQYLVGKGADIEQGGSTPLMEAAQEGHLDVVSYLITQGANIHACSAALDTALTCACGNGHTKVAMLLVDHNAEIEHESEGGRTPLMKAARQGHLETVKFLIDRGADANRCTANQDHTVLSLACAGGHLGVVQYLLSKGADPTSLLKDNSTMLIEAARGGHTAVACLLLKQAIGVPPPQGEISTAGVPSLQQQALLQASQAGLLGGVSSMMHSLAPPIENQNWDQAKLEMRSEATSGPMQVPGISLTGSFNMRYPPVGAGATPISARLPKSSRKRAPPQIVTSDESSLEDHLVPHPMTHPLPELMSSQQRQPPIGQCSPDVPSVAIETQAAMLPMKLHSNSYLGDFDNLRIPPEFLPSRNRGLLKSLKGGGMRRAFSMETLPREMIYGGGLEGGVNPIYIPAYPSIANQIEESALKNMAMPTKQEIQQFQEMLIRRVREAQEQILPGQDYRYYGYETYDDEEEDFDDDRSDVMEGSDDGSDGSDGGDGDDEDEGDEDLDLPELDLPPGTTLQPAIPIDTQTDSNHDTALTLAAHGGHDELTKLLITHGASIEHKDKKGCTPLILASGGGHAITVQILLEHGANVEAISDRTKDTALSLACSGGRQEVVDILLAKGANFEHRNVSDYTPLSLAASGGYVPIMKALLRSGADVNSRTGSKLGISPLMLAAMNGHTQAVKLLLDHGADINAQIETNRNTALTLACFQGRHEVVSLLCEHGANVEHRAKTGLTPLMEAASGGYYEVGKVLIQQGADVNAPPVPSSKDTALTIASDKGHVKFVSLSVKSGAYTDAKNKKGNTPLWLAANGGHLDVVKCLLMARADPDIQDNRKVSCLMAAFRKGHVKVVKYLLDFVSQFPSDTDCKRYISTVSDKDQLKKVKQCMDIIKAAKDRQADEANKNASILLQQLDMEKQNEEQKKLAAAKKREKKKKKKELKKAKASEDQPSQRDDGSEGSHDEKLITSTVTSISPSSSNLNTLVTASAALSTTATSTATTKDADRPVTTAAVARATTVTTSKKAPAGKVSMATKKSARATTVVTTTVSLTAVATATPVVMTTSPRKGKKEEGWKEVPKKYFNKPGKGGILQGQSVVLPSHATPTQPLLADLARSNLNNGSDTPVVGNVTVTRQQLMYPAVTKQQQTNQTVTKSVRPKGILSTPSKPASSNRQDKSTTAKTVTKKTQNVISNQSGQSQGPSLGAKKKGTTVARPSNAVIVTTTVTMTTTQTVSTVHVSAIQDGKHRAASSGHGVIPPISKGSSPSNKTTVSTALPTSSVGSTSVTMATKGPIASTSVNSSSHPNRKAVASGSGTVKSKSEPRAAGISYSAVVGGTKAKEEVPKTSAFSVPLLSSIATDHGDGTYQPFGPVKGAVTTSVKTISPDLAENSREEECAKEPITSTWVKPKSKSQETAVDALLIEGRVTQSNTSPKSASSISPKADIEKLQKEINLNALGPIGPPSKSERSPQSSYSPTHQEQALSNDSTPLATPDASPVSKETKPSSQPLLPTPFPPSRMESPFVKTPSTMTAGVNSPFASVRTTRPPLLSTPPIYPSTIQAPPALHQGIAYFQMPILSDPPPQMFVGEVSPPVGDVAGQRPLEGANYSNSSFNPNAAPFIPTFLHAFPGQPVAITPPQPNVIGILPDQPLLPATPIYQGYPEQARETEWGKSTQQRGLLPVPQPVYQAVAPASIVISGSAPQPTTSADYNSQPFMVARQQQSTVTSDSSEVPPLASSFTSSDHTLPKAIGTERAHKRSSSHGNAASFGQTSLPSALMGEQNLWTFSSTHADTVGSLPWTSTPPLADAPLTDTPISKAGEVYLLDDKPSDLVITQSDNIKTVLTRLSLSQHLNLFEENEIDLNALLLMTDKDYRELGLEEGPRTKLLSIISKQRQSTQSGETPSISEGEWLEDKSLRDIESS